MNNKPIKYTEWLVSRLEFMARIGWLSNRAIAPIFNDDDFVSEYREMLIALKKDCTVKGMAYTLGSTYSTIMKDRKRLGIANARRGGKCVPQRLFSHRNQLMTCQQVADLNGCCYATAYARLTMGVWIA